ncbi:MAG: GFA family protein [Pseudomonadota bacterium]|nr:GFA family protein [Pseudomonadota bacterium]
MDFRRIGLGMKKGINNQTDIARKFTLKGYCECKGICIQMKDTVADFSHCHCSQCRRIHGSAFVTFAGLPKSDFRISSGRHLLKCYESSRTYRRFFCNVCGSKLFLEVLGEPDQIYVAMGLFDTKPQNLPEPYHIYVGSKAFWHTITGKQVQYQTEP